MAEASSAPTETPDITSTPGHTSKANADTGSPSTQPAETSKSSPDLSESETSKPWIAGAVAGPILGLAALAVIFWLGMRHQRRKEVIADEVAPAGGKPREAELSELHGSLYSPALSELPGHGSPSEAAMSRVALT
ncbi:hypothetical protein ACHAQH_006185 [Verticillium albo-atrum]